jgi:hypothetical protein
MPTGRKPYSHSAIVAYSCMTIRSGALSSSIVFPRSSLKLHGPAGALPAAAGAPPASSSPHAAISSGRLASAPSPATNSRRLERWIGSIIGLPPG